MDNDNNLNSAFIKKFGVQKTHMTSLIRETAALNEQEEKTILRRIRLSAYSHM